MPTGRADRAALEARELAFTEFLDRRGLVLRTDLLGVWAAWLTPVFEPRRYRTWFFVADLPEGQRTRDVSSESDTVTWLPAMQAVRDVEAQRLLMLPPTYLTCLELGQYDDPHAVLDAARGSRGRDVHAAHRGDRGRRRPLGAGAARGAAGEPLMSGWTGGRFGDAGQCVLAPNANMMTLDGTNTWVLRAPDGTRSVVVDPGPPDAGHLDAVAEAAGDVAVVLLTHHHLDHSEAAKEFAERVGCGVRALDPEYRLGDEGLGEGDVVEVDDLEIRVVATPGPHQRLALLRAAVRAGGAHRRHRARAAARRWWPTPTGSSAPTSTRWTGCTPSRRSRRSGTIWPGHGPVIDDALGALDYYIAHRHERLQQVEDAVAELRRSRIPRASPPTSCRAGWWRSSTRTSTRCCGGRPSSRCGPSWPTWRLATEPFGSEMRRSGVRFAACARRWGPRRSSSLSSWPGEAASCGSAATCTCPSLSDRGEDKDRPPPPRRSRLSRPHR